MRVCPEVCEQYHVSARFRLTLEAAILSLESDAAEDERAVAMLKDADHRRRQRMLVQAQLERAFRLNELLGQTAIRPDRAA